MSSKVLEGNRREDISYHIPFIAMDTENVDLFVKLLKEVEEFLRSIDSSAKSKKSIEKDRKELLEKVKECHQKLSFQPEEYVDMSGYNTPAISTQQVDDSFDGLDLQSKTTRDEKDIVEEYNYECSENFLTEEKLSQEVTLHTPEEQLNLTDANPPSASELRAMAIKYGPLQRKDRFMFMEQFRRFWVAFNANRLYFYNNERDNKPQYWVDMANYTARSAPEVVRDVKKKNMCFELVCPANKTLQLIARTPKDMEQWIRAINYRITKTDQELGEPGTQTYENVLSQMETLPSARQLMPMADHKIEEDDAIYNDIQYTGYTENLYDDAMGNGMSAIYEGENLYDDILNVKEARDQLINNLREESVTETAKINKEPESVSEGVPFLPLRNRIQLLNRS